MADLWSWSRLSAFRDCPWSYWMHYVQDEIEAVVPIFGAGAEFHRVAEEYARHCLARGVGQDLDWAYARADCYDDADLADAISRFAVQMEFDWAMIARVGEGIERWFEVPLDESGEDILRGRIDLLMFNEVENQIWIWDYKLGRARYDLEWPPRQLVLYAWAMHQEYPDAWSTLLLILQPLLPPVKQWELQGRPNIDWARQIIERAKAALRQVENGEDVSKAFPVRPGNRCTACGYVLQCPLVCPGGDFIPALRRAVEVRGCDVIADQLEKDAGTIRRWLAGKHVPRDRRRLADLLAYEYLGAIRSDEVAQIGAEQLHAMQTAAGRLSKFVRPYIAETGKPIPVGTSMEAGIYLPEWANNGDLRLKPDDPRAFFDRCEGLDIDPIAQGLFTPDAGKIGKLIQDAKEELVAAEGDFPEFTDPERAKPIAKLEDRCTPVNPSASFGIRKSRRKPVLRQAQNGELSRTTT